MAAPAGSSPMIARQLTVFPEPDSPMMASVVPGLTPEADAVHGAQLTAADREADPQLLDLEQ